MSFLPNHKRSVHSNTVILFESVNVLHVVHDVIINMYSDDWMYSHFSVKFMVKCKHSLETLVEPLELTSLITSCELVTSSS